MQLLAEVSKSSARRSAGARASASGAGPAASPVRITDSAARAEDCAWAMLQSIPPAIWFIRKHMRHNRAAGLSIPQFRALMLIARNPSASLSQVAEHLSVSQPSASRLVSGLVSRGFVTRTESATDRRQICLLVTPRGRTVRTQAQAATQQHLRGAIAHLSPSHLQALADAMRILHEIFAPGENPSGDFVRPAQSMSSPRPRSQRRPARN